jgi:hypothetical protein
MRYTGKASSWILALGLVFSISFSAMAQDAATSGTAGGPGGRGGRGGGGGMYRIALQLPGITAEQKTKLEKGQADSQAKIQEVRKNGGGMQEFQKMVEEQKKDIETILTDDQKKEFETKVGEMRSRWGNRGGQTSGTAENK